MAGNSYGKIFRITTFGESHGNVLGVVIDGCPSRLQFDFDLMQAELNRRKPGQSEIVSQRKEDENFEILSGLFEGKTTGAPLTIIIRNTDQRTEDYDNLKNIFRPSHADYTYEKKYGIRDYRGGGRQSARETVSRVMAGAVAKMILNQENISIQAFVSQVHDIKTVKNYTELDLSIAEKNAVRCPDEKIAEQMIELIQNVKNEGDSVGGVVTCVCKNVPVGLGEPVFDKLHAELGKAILSINACKGFEIGSGFKSVEMTGSQHNDKFEIDSKNSNIQTATNFSGGVQGGISNGMDIFFNAAFKPPSTIKLKQLSVSDSEQVIEYIPEGRHDPCVVPRAVPIVEAMTAIVLVDFYLLNKMYK